MSGRTYIAIDLKSFYASVECVERGLDPLDTNLVVADESRTEKTICLAVSPSLKEYKIPGRARLFEVISSVKDINAKRRRRAKNYRFEGESFIASELKKNPNLALSYIAAPPRMALYTKYSTQIYQIYLKYVAPEDIHVYSIDEVFIDITDYMRLYAGGAEDIARMIISDVLSETGITATVGIGTNMYLSKIAMDIMAKKMKPDKNGARIAYLDVMTYRRELWGHTPLTDFWRIGKGYAKKLEANRLYTMGDVARFSLSGYGEEKLFKLFGINAELLIDHAWGYESCTIADIKAYRPQSSSISTGQVLQCPYDFEKTRLIVKEMTELLTLDLVKKGLVTNQIVLDVGYDIENIKNSDINYSGEITTDRYGRKIPKHAHGTENLDFYTASTKLITEGVLKLFDRVVDRRLLTRRLSITACRVKNGAEQAEKPKYRQLDLFSNPDEEIKKEKALKKEENMQRAMLEIKNKFGKNAVLKGMNFEEGATTIKRNGQIGGHKA